MRVEERTAELSKSNAFLKKEIAERKQIEKRLKAFLKEKEILLREIHHRVKNNLQIISSLLSLQSEYIKDEQALKMFNESRNRIKSMALIHEQLYKSKDLGRIDFGKYIRNLTDNLFHSYGVNSSAIRLKISVGGVFLGIETAILCGLIISELVANCLKHAFPEGRKGEIRISLRSDNDMVNSTSRLSSTQASSQPRTNSWTKSGRPYFTLIIGDNGVGFPEDLDFRNTESLGLQLVMMLVEQIGGIIELYRSNGTEFKIAFAELRPKGRTKA